MTKPVRQLSKSSHIKSHGSLLRQLYFWSKESTQETFGRRINRSRQWVSNSMKEERIPERDRIAICSAYGVPLEYWDGTINLTDLSFVQSGKSTEKPSEVAEALIDRDKRIMELQEKVIELQSELLRLHEELRYRKS